MNRLWAPWRKAYIRPDKKQKRGCLFCQLRDSSHDEKNLVLIRHPTCYAVLNRYPYNNGHVMIIPNRHLNSLSQMSDKERLDWLALTELVLHALEKTMNAQGSNIGMNLGKIAGAGIPGHLHLHIVPRWSGDHNFMPVITGTKVVSESLQSVYHALLPQLQRKKRNFSKKR